jgi:hypothetical protein
MHVTAHQFHVNVNLGALLGQLQAAIQRTIHLTALGLNAVSRLSQEDLQLPGTSIQLSLAGPSPWPIEEAQEAFSHWTLVNGFRDASEAVSGFLESTRTVLAVWQLGIRQQSTPLTIGDWQETVQSEGHRFHRSGLPDKIEHLQQTYGLSLDPDLIMHIRSINAARNCLVHRGGVVQERDTNEAGALRVSWRRLTLLVSGENGEREIFPSGLIEAGESLGVAYRDASKIFSVGTAISFSVQEFADLCWSLFLFGVSTTKLVETWGVEHGFNLQMPQDTTT